MKWGNNLAECPEEMAELLNKYFQSVFPGTPQKNVNYLQPLQIDCISTVKVTEEKIKLTLESLCVSKSAGPDGISPQVLKNLSPSLTSSIFLLIKTCCNKRLFPSVWKCADVTAIHKSGSKNNVENYRPISLLCVISKVFEKLIYDAIDWRIRKKLQPEQFGFTPKRSAISQMISFLSQVYDNFSVEENEIHSVPYLDFSKAFDRVNYSMLLLRLSSFGIGGGLLELIQSYLTDRYQRVKINNVVSQKLKVTSGVPQGFRLGPLFFLAYVDGLLEQTTSPTFAYADDIKLVRTNLRDTQQDICCIENWCIESDMKLNSDKVTELEIFKGEHQLVVNDQIVQKVRSQKDLGIIVTENLSWNDHAEERCKKATGAFFQNKKNLGLKTSQFLKLSAYCGYVMPILSYGSELLLLNNAATKMIESVRATAWILSDSKSSYKKRLETLKILPVSLYFEMHDLLLLSSIVTGKVDINWQKYISFSDSRTRSSTKTLKINANENLKTRQKADFWYRASILANLLSTSIDLFHDTETLKTRLSDIYWEYFLEYYNELTSCTWHIRCGCPIGTCSVQKRLKTTQIVTD